MSLLSFLPFVGDLIGAAGSAYGANQAAAASRRGAKISMKTTKWAGRKNAALQTRFAKRALRWRVEDAKKAGLHPLAALGAQIPGASPSFTAGDAGSILAQGGAAEGQMYAQMGQNLGAALSNLQGDPNAAYTAKVQALHLKNLELQNVALSADIAQKTQPGYAPNFPSAARASVIPGQGNGLPSSGYVIEPNKVTASEVGGAVEAGANPAVSFVKTGTGLMPVMSAALNDRAEDDLGAILSFNMSNRVFPTIAPLMGQKVNPALRPKTDPGKDMVWRWNPVFMEWRAEPEHATIEWEPIKGFGIGYKY